MIIGFALIVILCGNCIAETVVVWDFTKGDPGWHGNRMVSEFSVSGDGLEITSSGVDPWIEGPGVDIEENMITRVTIRMKSTADKAGELFYGRNFEAGKSKRFIIDNDGKWHEYELMIKQSLGRRTRFRLDPCNDAGKLTVAFIKVESLEKPVMPRLEKPQRVTVANSKYEITSGDLKLSHNGKQFGGFVCTVAGNEMLIGSTNELIGVDVNGKNEYLKLNKATVRLIKKYNDKKLIEETAAKDSRNTLWTVKRTFTADKCKGTINIETTVTSDKGGEVVYLPWLTVFSGVGTFGERKTQGLFPGIEYLADEPSSSDADIAKPNNIRRTPAEIKLTFPLMTIVHEGCYAGLIWDRTDMIAPTFDSPDLVYNSGGHLMSLTGPAVGAKRYENDFIGFSPVKFDAGQKISSKAKIIGRKGDDVTAAVKQYVEIKGLAELPEFEGGYEAAKRLLAHGWLDSDINEDGLIRHAVWTGFGAAPSAETAMFMDRLSEDIEGDLSSRLEAGRDKVLSRLPAGTVLRKRGESCAKAVNATGVW